MKARILLILITIAMNSIAQTRCNLPKANIKFVDKDNKPITLSKDFFYVKIDLLNNPSCSVSNNYPMSTSCETMGLPLDRYDSYYEFGHFAASVCLDVPGVYNPSKITFYLQSNGVNDCSRQYDPKTNKPLTVSLQSLASMTQNDTLYIKLATCFDVLTIKQDKDSFDKSILQQGDVLELVDLNGKVMEKVTIGNPLSFSFNSNYKGLYIISLTNTNGTRTFKINIQP